MPQFTPAPLDLNDPAVIAQQVAFIAALTDFDHGWANRAASIAGLATVLRDKDGEYDEETRDEFLKILQGDAHQLRRAALSVQWAARFLSGTPVPRAIVAVNVRELLENAAIHNSTAPSGGSAQFHWEDANPYIHCDEGHIFVILSTLIDFASWLAFGKTFDVVVQRDAANGPLFIFSGDTNSAFFTDPAQWFTINEKQGNDSIGLFVARELAQLHGGRVWVETANKTRFDFRLQLPLNQDKTDD